MNTAEMLSRIWPERLRHQLAWLFALLFAATLAGALVAQRLQRRRGKD